MPYDTVFICNPGPQIASIADFLQEHLGLAAEWLLAVPCTVSWHQHANPCAPLPPDCCYFDRHSPDCGSGHCSKVKENVGHLVYFEANMPTCIKGRVKRQERSGFNMSLSVQVLSARLEVSCVVESA